MHYDKKKIIGALFFLGLSFACAAFIYLLSTNTISLAYNDGYQPDQPIPFSHALHVGRYKMDCRYCHVAVEQGRHASIPSLDICMNCHLTVKTNSPWIQKLTKAYQDKQPVAWQKVHLLPDFVKFNHSLHIKALTQKKSPLSAKHALFFVPSTQQIQKTCTTCHGAVENMNIIYQHSSLSMGWCVKCHRKPEHKAPTNCTTCHY